MNIFECIRKAWGPDTACGEWHGGPHGHCAVTALVVQDCYGGDLLRAAIPGRGSHYWNRIPGMGEVDLAREQYPDDMPFPRGVPVSRTYILEGPRAEAARTAQRYAILKERVTLAAETLVQRLRIRENALRETIRAYEELADRARRGYNKHDLPFYLRRIKAHKAALASLLK